jgi:hypothetical protein
VTLAPSDERVTFSQSEVATPRLRTTARRVLFWFIIALLVVAFGVATLVLTGGAQDKNRLSATNPHSNGAEAVIQVLKGDGVDVSTPATVTAAVALARRHPESTTVVVYDQDSILSTQQYRSLRSAASHVILVEPDSAALDALAPGVDHAGALASTVRSANCSDPAARAAGTVSGLARGYRVASGGDAVGCFGSDGVFAMVQVVNPTQEITVVGATTPFTNGSIRQHGNAALALRLFGESTHLVWYLPTFADSSVVQDGVIPNPPWVLWAAVLAGVVLVAAGVWRGRRFGPVVVERMPVFVRASETLEGRSRLYQRSSARTHALDALRIGAISRMAVMCGLPTRASVVEVIGAIVRTTGRSEIDLRTLLLDATPATDSDLLRLSDDLALLEADVKRAVR